MKIRKGFVLEKVGDSYLCCAVGKLAREFSGFVRLNETGAFLWEILESAEVSEDELVSKMTAEYDIDEATAKRDIEAFLKILSDNNLME